jgi:hypothetical protein
VGILDTRDWTPGSGPGPPKIVPGRVGIAPPGFGETLEMQRAHRRIGPWTGRPRWHTISATLKVCRWRLNSRFQFNSSQRTAELGEEARFWGQLPVQDQ